MSSIRLLGPAALLMIGFALAGCGQSAPGKLQIEVASLDEVQKYVTEHKGKVVVLDLWSTSCQPCVRELPGLARLTADHQDDVVTISLNVDYYGSETPEKLLDGAEGILAKHGAAGKNFLSSTKDEEVYEKIGASPVPIVMVYDRTGKVAKQFVNDKKDEYGKDGFTYQDHITPLVKELVAAKGP